MGPKKIDKHEEEGKEEGAFMEEGGQPLINPLNPVAPIRPRIQTAEGWKRSQLKKRREKQQKAKG